MLRNAASALLVALLAAAPASAAVTKTELAGNDLATYPYFEYVHAINEDSPVHVAIDPTRFPAIYLQTCDIYVVNAKNTAGWIANNSLTDVTSGGMLTHYFNGLTIQANTVLVAGAFELSGAAGTGLGVGYDAVLDCNQNGLLDGNDFIDGPNNESGFYVVGDTTAPGPLAVTELDYSLSPGVAGAFGIAPGYEAENVFYPTGIGSMGQLPLVVISHGNGHSYDIYDHIGNHLASYGYIVMSHANDTGPSPLTASFTTLGHTDAFIDQALAGLIPLGGSILATHLDPDKIVWIGHSRGGEGVAIAYDRLYDGTYTPVHYDKDDIKLISSMLPTDFEGTAVANPHSANYHLWTASGDEDVDGSAFCDLCQTYHLHDRAQGHRQSTTVQGTGHAWFHNGGGYPYFVGPCPIGEPDTHLIQLGHLLPLIKRYVEDNIPSIDFLTRQYESFRPMGAPTGSCIVVSHEYYDASVNGTVVLDDYQSNFATNTSSSGAAVTYTVSNLSEGLLDDNDWDFYWTGTDPFNGATQGSASGGQYVDTTRGVVFDWNGANKYYEWAVPAAEQDFTDNLFLSFRGAQASHHPYTVAVLGDLTFTVTLRDTSLNTSSISIGAHGGGLEEPFQRDGGWHNEMETIRLRLTDFLNNGSGLDLANVAAVRLNVGPSWGSAQGRVVIDDLVLSNDRAVYDGGDNGDPHITTVTGENYDFQSAGEFTVLRRGDMEIQARQTPVSSAPPIYNAHTQLATCVSVNTAVAAKVAGHRVSYQPSLDGDASPDGMELRVDGQLIDIDSVLVVPLGGDAKVKKAGVGVGIEIEFEDGTYLAAIPGWWSWQNVWYLNLVVKETPATEGIMGYIPNGSWLPRLPDGTSMGPRPGVEAVRFNDLYVTFADAWRVTNATSLFDYGPGLSTKSFTDKSFPSRNGERCDIPGHPPIKPIAIGIATELCRPIKAKNLRDNCIFDVAQTGERNFAKTYALLEVLDEHRGEEPPKK